MTIMELMVAIGILMLVLGLTISGVMKAGEAAKQRRVEVMREAIYSAITAFRQNEGYWPGLKPAGGDALKVFSKENSYGGSFKGVGFGGVRTVLGENSAILDAFEGKARQYLDPSAIMVRKRSSREVTTWRLCREKDNLAGNQLLMVEGPGTKDGATGRYKFRYFVIIYNLDNDSVEVLRDNDMGYEVGGAKYVNDSE